MGDSVRMEESERSIQPRFAPPLPTETVTLARARQMVPNLLFDPVADVREAPARMADRKVLHPSPQNRVDFRNHLAEGPGPMAAENLLERAQRHPSVAPRANPTEVKAQKSEALALREVHPPTLLLVHLDLERRQFLSESPFDRRTKPALARMPVHQDHKIIGEPGVLDIRPSLSTSDLLRSLQHRVHLVEIHVTEQWRNHSALRNTLSARRLQHHPEEPQHRVVAHPTRNLLEYDVMSHRIEIRSQVEVNDVGLALQDGVRNALDRRLR